MKAYLLVVLSVVMTLGLQAQNRIASVDFETASANKVMIEGIFCDVNVIKGSSVKVHGLIEGSGKEGDYLMTAMHASGHVIVQVKQHQKSKNWNWNSTSKAVINVEIPDGTDLEISNTSGDVKVTKIGAGEMTVVCTSGDIEIESTGGELDVVATSGDISISDFDGDMRSVTTSGSQEYRMITGSINGAATSGDIDGKHLNGDVTLATTSGGISVEEMKGVLSMKATSGDLEAEDLLLSGKGYFHTTSGEISVSLNNEEEELSFDLRAVSGDIKLNNKREEDQLKQTGSSDIWVKAISTSGDQTIVTR